MLDYRRSLLQNHFTNENESYTDGSILQQDILKIRNGNSQLGFRKEMGTREALFGLNVLTQRRLGVNQVVYIGFIDFEKAFDHTSTRKANP